MVPIEFLEGICRNPWKGRGARPTDLMISIQSQYRSLVLPVSKLECSGAKFPYNYKSSFTNFYGRGLKRSFVMKTFLRQKYLGTEAQLHSAGSLDECKTVHSDNAKGKGDKVLSASSSTDVETSNLDEAEKEKSEVYSSNMTEAMGAVLTYRHELGMNYNFVLPDLIVGSCLQSPADVDRLKDIGVGTIFCLQQNSDLEYFGVDISSIQQHAKEYDELQHIRAEIRDFDAFDLRMRLPTVVGILLKSIRKGQGITYIHCTAGLGRAPAVTLAYMFWVLGYKLDDANKMLQSVRPCFPKLDAIRSATADMLTDGSKQLITLKWKKGKCSSVEVSGLDIGWGQRIPLAYDEDQGCWLLQRELPEGRYEYKYIIDENWTYSTDELVTPRNKDGHVNNYIEVTSHHLDDEIRNRRQQLMREDIDLTKEERQIICKRLEALADAD